MLCLHYVYIMFIACLYFVYIEVKRVKRHMVEYEKQVFHFFFFSNVINILSALFFLTTV